MTGCDYLRGMRRCAISTERSINIWDNRAKGKNQVCIIYKGNWKNGKKHIVSSVRRIKSNMHIRV